MIEYILLPALAIIGVAWLMGSFESLKADNEYDY